jgi:molecular chaperone IbpA
VEEDEYRITMAVAGFSADELEMIHHQNRLTIKGQKKEQEEANYLHRGIATRSFNQVFNLADHVKVTGADLRNGLLTVELKREVPEALRPRRIEIATGGGQNNLRQDNEPQQIDLEARESKVA